MARTLTIVTWRRCETIRLHLTTGFHLAPSAARTVLAVCLLAGIATPQRGLGQCVAPDTTWQVTSTPPSPDTTRVITDMDSAKYYRTDAIVLFRDGLSRAAKAAILAKYCLQPRSEGPDGTMFVQSPDPGRTPTAFWRYWEHVRQDPDIVALVPDCYDGCFTEYMD